MVGNNGITHTHMLANTFIKSKNGLNEVDIICGNSNCDIINNNKPKIQCGMNYEFECEIEMINVIGNNYTNTYWQGSKDNIESDYICDNTDSIDLMCVINGGNKYLMDKQVKTIQELSILLDGNTYTYEPWMERIGHNALDKSHLIFKWNCEYDTLTSDIWMNCNEMFNGMDSQAMTYVYFNTKNIIENEYYMYKYTLDVMDVNNNKGLCEV